MKVRKYYRALLLLLLCLGISANCVMREASSKTATKSMRPRTAPPPGRGPQLGERVHLFGGMVSFKPPVEFSTLTEEQVRKNFKAVLRPGIYYGSKDVRAAVAVGYLEQKDLRSEQLGQIKAQLEKKFAALPAFSWVENGSVEINGVRWVNLVADYKDDKGKSIRNNVCLTLVEGRGLIMFGFSSNKGDYEKYSKVLRESKGTIEIQK